MIQDTPGDKITINKKEIEERYELKTKNSR